MFLRLSSGMVRSTVLRLTVLKPARHKRLSKASPWQMVFQFLWCTGRGISVVCAALQAAIRIQCWRRNRKEVRQLLISICGLLRRSESGASHGSSLQRIVLLEKPLWFTLKNLPGKRRISKEGEEKSWGFGIEFHLYSQLSNVRISLGLVSSILTSSDLFVDWNKFILLMEHTSV